MASGKEYPKAIANAPEIEIGNDLFYFAFIHLDTCRLYELGPIPYTTIRDYALELELDEEQFERFVAVITRIDQWLRGVIAGEIKAKQEAAKNG